MNLLAGNKRLQVKSYDENDKTYKTYQIRNDLLEEAMEYAGLIENGSIVLSEVPENLKALVETLITK